MASKHKSKWVARGAVSLALFVVGCVEDGDVLEENASATGSPADECTDLDQADCTQTNSQACVAIWGTPYVEDREVGWCLMSNGLQYLGCRAADACTATPNGTTVCAATTDATSTAWVIEWDCLPAEIDGEVCEPPTQQAPFC